MDASPYVTRLTQRDWELIAEAAGADEQERARSDPGRLEEVLRSPDLFARLFGAGPEGALVRASPFLAFDALLLRLRDELEHTTFVSERVGADRIPVFDVGGPRAFLDGRSRRLFLADLLSSYVRVASGSVWFHTGRGWRRRRYSELDPVQLAGLVDVVPDAQRPSVYRRLGDLCLFLAGVFPDHATSHPIQPRHLARIARLLGGGTVDAPVPSELVLAGGSGLWELEWIGRRAYRQAASAGGPVAQGLDPIVKDFGQARRVLDLLTRRHLFPARGSWFGRPGGDPE